MPKYRISRSAYWIANSKESKIIEAQNIESARDSAFDWLLEDVEWRAEEINEDESEEEEN